MTYPIPSHTIPLIQIALYSDWRVQEYTTTKVVGKAPILSTGVEHSELLMRLPLISIGIYKPLQDNQLTRKQPIDSPFFAICNIASNYIPKLGPFP